MGLLLVLGCWDTEPTVPAPCPDAPTVRLPTEDGATIALHHHPADGPPVLLVHGISSNHRFFDLDADHSLARWLVARGYDAWLLDLRGHGDALVGLDGRRQQSGWTVDDYGRYDTTAAMAHVRAATGYDTVAFVGHSMGGMVGAIYAVSGGADTLASLTFLGSPGTFSRDTGLARLAGTGFAVGGATLLAFDTRVLAGAAADLDLRLAVQDRLYNPANYAPDTVDRMLRGIVSPISRREMRHFARMIRRERFTSWDGTVDYLDALGGVTLPTLLVAGLGDGVVPPAWVEAYAPALAGPVEVFRAGRATGLAEDYAHLDLALAERADTEIFPRIADWIARWPPRRAVDAPTPPSGAGTPAPAPALP